MSWLMNVPPFARARRALKGRADRVWSRDRALLRGLAAFGNRTFRIAIHTIRGIVAHRIGLHAAALTYYTVFALVPTLVVALWVARASDRLPALSSALPALKMILLHSVDRTTALVSGIVGLGALLFAAVEDVRRHGARAADHRRVRAAHPEARRACSPPRRSC